MTIKIYTEEERKAQRRLTKELNKISVAEIATNMYGLSLYSDPMDRGYVRCHEHAGMKIDMVNNLVSFNGIENLNGNDFISCYERISCLEARSKLSMYHDERDPRNLLMYYYSKQKNQVYEYTGLFLPKKSRDTSKLEEFFHGKGINDDTFKPLIDAGLLYQDELWNRVVFVGFDEHDEPAFGCAYNTNEPSYKQDCNGSYDKIGWGRIQENSDTVVICASPMEALAYLSVDEDASVFCSKNASTLIDTLDYAQSHYKWFENVSNLKLTLCADNKQNQALFEKSKSMINKNVERLTAEDVFSLYSENLSDEVDEIDIEQLKKVESKNSILEYLKDLDDKVDELMENEEQEKKRESEIER